MLDKIDNCDAVSSRCVEYSRQSAFNVMIVHVTDQFTFKWRDYQWRQVKQQRAVFFFSSTST